MNLSENKNSDTSNPQGSIGEIWDTNYWALILLGLCVAVVFGNVLVSGCNIGDKTPGQQTQTGRTQTQLDYKQIFGPYINICERQNMTGISLKIFLEKIVFWCIIKSLTILNGKWIMDSNTAQIVIKFYENYLNWQII